MTGNAVAYGVIRYHRWLLTAAGNHPCDQCGGYLPDHDWADLDPAGTVVDCSGQTR